MNVPFSTFLSELIIGDTVHVDNDESIYKKTSGDFNPPLFRLEWGGNMSNAGYADDIKLFVEEVFNPFLFAFAPFVLKFTGLVDTESGEFLPVEKIEGSMDQFNDVSRKDNFTTLAFEVAKKE